MIKIGIPFALAALITSCSQAQCVVPAGAAAKSGYVSQIVQALQSDSTTTAVFVRYKRPLDSIIVSPVAICIEPNVVVFEMLLRRSMRSEEMSADSVYLTFKQELYQDRYCIDDSSDILWNTGPLRNPFRQPTAYVSRSYLGVVKNREVIAGELYIDGDGEGGYESTWIRTKYSYLVFIALFEGGRLKEFVTAKAVH